MRNEFVFRKKRSLFSEISCFAKLAIAGESQFSMFCISRNRALAYERMILAYERMILEVQIQIFAACCCMHVKVFILKKFQGAQILIFFDENWHAASFYIKEQTQKYKFEI